MAGLFSWLLRRKPPETKASAAGGAISAWNLGQPIWTPRDYASFSEEGYQRNAVVFRCVKMIAGGAASVPWLLYDRGGTEIERHELLDLLSAPAPMIAGAALFEALYAYLLLAGNAYLEAVGPSDTRPPRELWALRPDRTRVIAGRMGMPLGYEYEANGHIVRWQVDQVTGQGPVLHIREFNPLDDWYGMGRIEAAAYGVDRHNAASIHNKALLDNGARPSGALIFEPTKNSDGDMQMAPQSVIAAAEGDLIARHGGPGQAGRPLVLGGSVRWEEMGVTPKDMDFISGKEDSARDICLAFGVPHVLLVPGSSTYNNVREAKLEMWEETILPLIDRMLDDLNAWLVPRFGDRLKLAVDLDEVPALEPRRESKRGSVMLLLEKGVIDSDEAREALQYGPRSPTAVKKIDPAVITGLLAAVETVGLDPLVKYMTSVGLFEPGTTADKVLDAANAYLEELGPSDEDVVAALPAAVPEAATEDGAPDDQPE